MGKTVGIDLGTTYCAVAQILPGGKAEVILNEEGGRITPSVVQFHENGGMSFGSEAKEAAEFGEPGCAQAFKRRMGDDSPYCTFFGRSYSSEQLSGYLLKHLKESAEKALGDRITGAVVTVPAYFKDRERKATQNAAKAAGLPLLCLLDEPVAAAINYGMGHWRNNAVIMVYDLGGGTFDVTLVKMENGRLETVRTMGNHQLGGKDWDSALIDIICRKYRDDTGDEIISDSASRYAIGQEVENCKISLSQGSQTSVTVSLPDGSAYRTTVTREEFEAETRGLLDATGSLCRKVLQDAGIDWSGVTDILLVGGSTRMPQVKQYLQALSGHAPLQSVNPDEAVALGAALRAKVLADSDMEIAYQAPDRVTRPDAGNDGDNGGVEVAIPTGAVGRDEAGDELSLGLAQTRLPHALGVVAVNPDATAYVNQVIVPTNSVVPCSTARRFNFYTQKGADNEMEIYLLEGGGKLFSPDCAFLAKYVVTGIRHVKGGPAEIRIQYSKDISSITHIQARQGTDREDLPMREVPLDDVSRFRLPPEKPEPVRDELTIVMALDVSGSMHLKTKGKEAIDYAKDAMCGFVQQYSGTGTKFGVLAVSDRTKWFIRPTDDEAAVIRAIHSIKCCCTGVCNAAHPFDDILEGLKRVKGKRYGIVLADGVWENQPRAVSRARDCHREQIDIIGLGFGEVDARFMRDISSAGEIVTSSSADLSASFGKIAQTIGTGGDGGSTGMNGDAGLADTWEVR